MLALGLEYNQNPMVQNNTKQDNPLSLTLTLSLSLSIYIYISEDHSKNKVIFT